MHYAAAIQPSDGIHFSPGRTHYLPQLAAPPMKRIAATPDSVPESSERQRKTVAIVDDEVCLLCSNLEMAIQIGTSHARSLQLVCNIVKKSFKKIDNIEKQVAILLEIVGLDA